MENKERIDIFDIILMGLKHKIFILFFTGIASIIAVSYSLLTPELWTSQAVLMPEKSNSLGLGSSGLLGSLGGGLFSGSNDEGIKMLTILSSKNTSIDIINKFNLLEYFELIDNPDIKKAYDIAMMMLRGEVLSTYINQENGAIVISAKTKDKKLSKDIVDYCITFLEKYNREYTNSKGKNKRIFLEKRIKEIEKEENELLEESIEYAQKNKVIHIEEQSKQLLLVYKELISQKVELEIKRRFQSEFINKESLKSLQNKISVLNEEIKNLEIKGNGGYFPKISDIPDFFTQKFKQETALVIFQEIKKTIYPQLELARLEELKDTPTLDILEYPMEAGLRSWPKRAVICIIIFFCALMFSFIISVSYEYLDKEQKSKISLIFKSLLFIKK
ncbi:MAG: hypothetical protein CSB55_03920 [Candidatus Cloacimonadota bacterium]|nr:MAG: hypothetical protein CSB55_03920 [Candidatus Cloacimonadota bacterium]